MDKNTLEILENRLIIKHRNFAETHEEIVRRIQHGRHDEPIAVIGPTGVGKTKLTHYLADYLIRRQSEGWRKDAHPPLIIEAPEPNDGKFPWRAFLEDLLEALGEVDLSKKVDLDKAEENRRLGKRAPALSRLTIGQLVKLLRKRINALLPVAILIDECQNLVDGVSDSERKANVNRMKSWANQMRTKFILFGTHEAKALLNLNEQLSRRVDPIYFPRYQRDDEEDVKEFARFYLSIAEHLNLKIDSDCHKDFFTIYDYSLGTSGLLISWLHKSIAYCVDRNIPKITPQILKKHRFSTDRLHTIEQAVKNFEAYINSSHKDFNPALVEASEGIVIDMFDTPRSIPESGKRRRAIQKLPRSHKVHANQL